MKDGIINAHRNFYGRIKGKKLSAKQQARLDHLLPTIRVVGVAEGRADLAASFGHNGPYWLEIGFGGGEHLAHIATQHPEIGIIGAEPYVNGVAAALRHIEEGALANVRVHDWDARALFDALPNGALSRVYLLYPDPWPKARHAERRFMHPDNLHELARLMKSGAELRVASDIAEYIEHTLVAISQVPEFQRREHSLHTPWAGWTRTRFEAKAIKAGREPHYLIFTRA